MGRPVLTLSCTYVSQCRGGVAQQTGAGITVWSDSHIPETQSHLLHVSVSWGSVTLRDSTSISFSSKWQTSDYFDALDTDELPYRQTEKRKCSFTVLLTPAAAEMTHTAFSLATAYITRFISSRRSPVSHKTCAGLLPRVKASDSTCTIMPFKPALVYLYM